MLPKSPFLYRNRGDAIRISWAGHIPEGADNIATVARGSMRIAATRKALYFSGQGRLKMPDTLPSG